MCVCVCVSYFLPFFKFLNQCWMLAMFLKGTNEAGKRSEVICSLFFWKESEEIMEKRILKDSYKQPKTLRLIFDTLFIWITVGYILVLRENFKITG